MQTLSLYYRIREIQGKRQNKYMLLYRNFMATESDVSPATDTLNSALLLDTLFHLLPEIGIEI